MAITHDNVEKLRVSWGSDNDGSGSGLDADTIDTLDSTNLYQIKTFSGDIDLVNTAGSYEPSGATNYPGSRSQFMLNVSVSGGFVHQHLVNDTTQFQRRSTDSGGTWGAWVETLTSTSTSGPFVLKAGDTITGKLSISPPSNTQYGLNLVSNVTDPTLSYQFAERIQQNMSGSAATGGDKTQGGLLLDINSSTTGGDTSDEHRVYGTFTDVDVTGDSDWIVGNITYVNASHSSGTITSVYGVDAYAVASQTAAAANVSTVIGVLGQGLTDNANGVAISAYGGYFKTYTGSDGGGITNAKGVYGEVEANNDTIGAAMGVQSHVDINAGSVTNAYLFYGGYAGSPTGSEYGIYLSTNSGAKNYLSSSLSIGTTGSLGDNSITIGDSDTGFRQNGDGNLGHYANNKIIFHTTTGGINIDSNKVINHNTTNSYDKIRVWNSSSYTIGMKSAQSYGALNDYAMTFTMNDDNNRGWLWRKSNHTASQGAMSLSCSGVLTVQTLDGATINGGTY